MVVTNKLILVTFPQRSSAQEGLFNGGFADWEAEPATEVEYSHVRVNPDATRDGLPRIDMKALGPQRLSMVFDSSSPTSVGLVTVMPQTALLLNLSGYSSF
jgi:hypothetical protein